MQFKRVQPGQDMVIPADAYNAFCAAAEAVADRRAASPAWQKPAPVADRELVRVKNVMGYGIERFVAVVVGNFTFDDSITDTGEATVPIFDASMVTAGTDHDRIAITQEPIPNGEVGWAKISGISHAFVNVTDVAHGRATPTDAGLGSDVEGPLLILWKESGTGDDKRALILLGDTHKWRIELGMVEAPTPPDELDAAASHLTLLKCDRMGIALDPAEYVTVYTSNTGGPVPRTWAGGTVLPYLSFPLPRIDGDGVLIGSWALPQPLPAETEHLLVWNPETGFRWVGNAVPFKYLGGDADGVLAFDYIRLEGDVS